MGSKIFPYVFYLTGVSFTDFSITDKSINQIK
jgi:hypothetical protein